MVLKEGAGKFLRRFVIFIICIFDYTETLFYLPFAVGGPVSSVGIATVYGLDGPGIESRWG